MSVAPTDGVNIGCPERGVLRLLSPFPLTSHGEVMLLPEKFNPRILHGRNDSPLLTDAVYAVMGLHSEIVKMVRIGFFSLDVNFPSVHPDGELAKIVRALTEVCGKYERPFAIVGSSERDLVFQ
jgi:hypothetical protein